MELELINIPMVISPLHNKDKNDVERQEYKKARYHVIYVTTNPATTYSAHKRVQRALGNESIAKVQVVRQSMEDVYLHLTHESEDAITKSRYRYAKRDIKLLSNFDIDRHVVLDIKDREETLNDICGMIDDHGSVSIRELGRFVKEHGSDYNSPSMKAINGALRSHTGLVRLYLDAVYQERKYEQSYVDMHTGEIEEWF